MQAADDLPEVFGVFDPMPLSSVKVEAFVEEYRSVVDWPFWMGLWSRDTTHETTVSVAEAVAFPAGEYAVMAYVVSVLGETVAEPEADTQPTLLMYTPDTAFVVFQESVAELPPAMVAGRARRDPGR